MIVAAYLLAMAGVGLYFSRRQKSLDHFILANRSMGWLPVGLSLMAALNSGMDYLMQPSATIRYGFVLAVGVLSWLAVYPWVAKVAFPFYRRLNVYTAYEYLEARFDVRVRTLGATIFVVWRVGWMATAMYVPSLAINAASGGQVDLNTVTIAVGIIVTLYTMLGGIQAVIWNDVIQFCIMFGGLFATVAIVLVSVPGGLPAILDVAGAAGKLDLWPPLVDPSASTLFEQVGSFFTKPITVVSLMASLIFGRMATYTSDQVMVQRLQTTRSLKDARQAFIVNAVGDAVWMIGLCFIGLALFAYFETRILPPEFQTDKLVPYFMSLAFPVGAVGLVIAAIMAASISSIDSAINSCSSVAVVDFYQRLWLGRDAERSAQTVASARHLVTVSRVATVFFGTVGTVLACNVSGIGTLLEIANKLVNAFSGPLFGIFLLAMFSPRSRSGGVLVAGVLGAAVSYYVAYESTIGFMWPSTFGLAASLAVGGALAVVLPAPDDAPGRQLIWRAVMARPVS